jgi:hypothetical protein
MGKAQISQVFTYLVIILVVGILVLMGYKGIIWIIDSQCDHQSVLFEKALMDFIDEYSDYGSVHEETLKAPCGVTEICFADSSFYEPSAPVLDLDMLGNDSVVKSAVDDKTSNIFTRTKFTKAVGFSNKIVLLAEERPYVCYKVRGGDLKFVFTGLGRKTQIESGWAE